MNRSTIKKQQGRPRTKKKEDAKKRTEGGLGVVDLTADLTANINRSVSPIKNRSSNVSSSVPGKKRSTHRVVSAAAPLVSGSFSSGTSSSQNRKSNSKTRSSRSSHAPISSSSSSTTSKRISALAARSERIDRIYGQQYGDEKKRKEMYSSKFLDKINNTNSLLAGGNTGSDDAYYMHSNNHEDSSSEDDIWGKGDEADEKMQKALEQSYLSSSMANEYGRMNNFDSGLSTDDNILSQVLEASLRTANERRSSASEKDDTNINRAIAASFSSKSVDEDEELSRAIAASLRIENERKIDEETASLLKQFQDEDEKARGLIPQHKNASRLHSFGSSNYSTPEDRAQKLREQQEMDEAQLVADLVALREETTEEVANETERVYAELRHKHTTEGGSKPNMDFARSIAEDNLKRIRRKQEEELQKLSEESSSLSGAGSTAVETKTTEVSTFKSSGDSVQESKESKSRSKPRDINAVTRSSTPISIDVNESQPTIRVQIRFSNNKRIIQKFNHHHTINDMISVVSASKELQSDDYYLVELARGKPKRIEKNSFDTTIVDYGLGGAVVLVEEIDEDAENECD